MNLRLISKYQGDHGNANQTVPSVVSPHPNCSELLTFVNCTPLFNIPPHRLS